MTAATGNAALHVGAAQQLGPLTLFPVWSDADASTRHRTHAEATSALQITERLQPTVSWLTVTNTSHRPVLLLDGELLAGGSQDRISTATHLLAPQTATDLPVACVEQGRWAPSAAGLQRVGHATPTLRGGNHRSLAHPRSRHSSTGDQAGTWREVARLRGHSGAPAPTGSLTDVDRHVRRDQTTRPAQPRPLEGQRGLLIGHGGRIRSLDVLASHRDLAAYWQPLLQAAWLEASTGPTIPVRSGQARRFVTQLYRLGYRPRPSRGLGQNLRATGPGITAAALHHRGQPFTSPPSTSRWGPDMHYPSTPTTTDRHLGALLGTALGDALGAPFEGRRRVPTREIDELIRSSVRLDWTDDTHMAIALAESLLACDGAVDPQHLGDTFAAAYRGQPWRGYAGGPPQVFALAAEGHPYQDAARTLYEGGSYGNGGAMRTAPAAIIAHPDLQRAAQLAAAQASITHAHPLGIDGAVLLTCAIVTVASAQPAGGLASIELSPIAQHLTTMAMQERLDAIIQAGDDPDQLMGLARRFGSRVAAVQSVPTALAVFLAHRNEPLAAITAAITLGRDTDTVAAMAGALAGAHHGAARLPEHLLERLEDRDRIEALARQLAVLP